MFPKNPLIVDFSMMRLFQRRTQTWGLVVATLPPLSTACSSNPAPQLHTGPGCWLTHFLSKLPLLSPCFTGTSDRGIFNFNARLRPLTAYERAAVICDAEDRSQQHNNGTDPILCLCGPSPVPAPGDLTACNMKQDSAGQSKLGHSLLMLTTVSPSIPQPLVMLTFKRVEEINSDTQI